MTSWLPVATTVLAMIMSIEPLPIRGGAEVTPAFVLMAAYHWTVYRPDLLPAWALFTMGTLEDLLVGGPPGVTALTLLLCRAMLLPRRRDLVGRPFFWLWAGFALLAGAATLFTWALNSLLSAQLLGLRGPVFGTMLTIGLFPVASFLLGRTQRALPGAA
jgi:rod shape-determining protein MreD